MNAPADEATLPAAVVTAAAVATRHIALFCARLDSAVYGSAEFVATVRTLAIAHPVNRVRVLIRQPEAVLIDGDHRLVELARAVPSRIQLRAAPAVANTRTEEWLLIDRAHCLLRPDPSQWAYRYAPDNPGHARRLLAVFDRYWEHGEASRELAALRL